MTTKKIYFLLSAIPLLCGVVLGGLVTDYVHLFGATRNRYLIAFAEEQTPENIAKCVRRGVIYGQNYSTWNTASGRPEYCLIEAEAKPLPDGGIEVFPATKTWYGRLVEKRPPTYFYKDEIADFSLSIYSYSELP